MYEIGYGVFIYQEIHFHPGSAKPDQPTKETEVLPLDALADVLR